jgi:hypothetical protein
MPTVKSKVKAKSKAKVAAANPEDVAQRLLRLAHPTFAREPEGWQYVEIWKKDDTPEFQALLKQSPWKQFEVRHREDLFPFLDRFRREAKGFDLHGGGVNKLDSLVKLLLDGFRQTNYSKSPALDYCQTFFRSLLAAEGWPKGMPCSRATAELILDRVTTGIEFKYCYQHPRNPAEKQRALAQLRQRGLIE